MKKCQLDKQDDTTKAHQQSDQLSHDFAHLKKHKFLVSFRKHERKLFLERASSIFSSSLNFSGDIFEAISFTKS